MTQAASKIKQNGSFTTPSAVGGLTKRSFDVFTAGILLVLLCPLLALIALAIRITMGKPIMFVQTRLGLGAEPFKIYKFRTMVNNADELLDSNGSVSNVSRVTALGKILRFSSIDELPQLINILKGEMSIIGPRPVLPEHFSRYSEEQKHRFQARPGVTGLAQIRGRNTLKWSLRLAADIEYINNWTFGNDLRILLRTCKVVFFREGISADRNPDEVDDLPKS